MRVLVPMLVALLVGSSVGTAVSAGSPPSAPLMPMATLAVTDFGASDTRMPSIGAILVTPLLNLLGIRDWRARGFAAGLAAHGIGTAGLPLPQQRNDDRHQDRSQQGVEPHGDAREGAGDRSEGCSG
jgi:hypothetical protein